MKLGIDLGGTKIEVCVLDQGREVLKQRIQTPKDNYQSILKSITQLVHDVDAQVGQILPIGMGTPGAMSPQTGLMRNSNTVCMNGKPVLDDLQQCLQRPVKIQNDANCFALSEAVDGAGAGHNLVFGVIIGTGTGGGFVFNQRVFCGRHAIAGEWGHNPLPWLRESDYPLQDCYCGKQGCIETFLSGPGMALGFQQKYDTTKSSEQIVALAEQGHIKAQQQMQDYYDRLARALAHVINMTDPDVIVLGGGMSNIKSLYSEVSQRLARYVFSDFVETPIKPAHYGDSSGVRGAAWLW